MFCIKCGAELTNDMLFCPFCGAPVQTTVNPQLSNIKNVVNADGVNLRKKKGRWQKKHIFAISSVIIITIVVVILSYLTFNPIKSDGSEYSNRNKYEVMAIGLNDTDDVILIDSKGNVFSDEFEDILGIGDNGIIAGLTSNSLFIIKDSEYLEVTNRNNLYENGSYTPAIKLCGSGEKLFYADSEKTIYSYDTKTEKVTEIYTGELLDIISYHGNVVTFLDGYCKIGDGKPFVPTTFIRQYKGISDSGKNIYYEQDDYNRDFKVYDGKLHSNTTIHQSDTIGFNILAHNALYSELLYSYNGDTYYYIKDSKTLVCMDAALYPLEGIMSNKGLAWHATDTFSTGNFISQWILGRASYIETGMSRCYDDMHSVDSIKQNVYLMFNDDGRHSVSIIYLDKDLNVEILAEDITRHPIISDDGKYIWAVSNNLIYRVDMTTDAPVSRSVSVAGLTWYDSENVPVALPIALSDDGKNAYCIGDIYSLDYTDGWSYWATILGTLYYIDMNSSSPQIIERDVANCISGAGNAVYYITNYSSDSRAGTLYSYSSGNGKEQIANDVNNMFIFNSSLYMLKCIGEHQSHLNLYKYDKVMSGKIAENIFDGIIYKNY